MVSQQNLPERRKTHEKSDKKTKVVRRGWKTEIGAKSVLVAFCDITHTDMGESGPYHSILYLISLQIQAQLCQTQQNCGKVSKTPTK